MSNTDPTLKDLRRLRAAMEKSIEHTISDFEETTGTRVESVNIISVDTLTQNPKITGS